MCFSPAIGCSEKFWETDGCPYFLVQLPPDSVFLVCLDDDVKVIKVLDNKMILFVHCQQDLLHCGITAKQPGLNQYVLSGQASTDHVNKTPVIPGISTCVQYHREIISHP